MKKIIISFTLIVLLSGCFAAGTKPAVTNQAQPEPNINIEAQPQAVSLTEFNDKAKEAMPAWFTLWTEVYNGSGGFSLEDFSSGLPIEIEYYKEYDYDETRGNDEPGGFSIVKLNSPDNKYRVLVFYGNDPDSGAAIVDLATKRIKHFTSMQCGTPCIFTDGFWIDNDRFIVAGNTEAYPFGYLETNASGKNYEAPFIYLVDLSQNLLTRYEHRNPVSRERYDDVRAMLVEQQKNKDKLRKIIPLGYFKEPKSETEGIAYLKSENSDLFVYKYINGVKTNTNFSLFLIIFMTATMVCLKAYIILI
ncbi:MAG: hypothetical protein NTX82_03985 [Candidatus Parcubacteria bacterium]|nr:hypothetical protein [Candidatus Parcubacteria bacterium]